MLSYHSQHKRSAQHFWPLFVIIAVPMPSTEVMNHANLSILIDLSVWIILFDSTGCVCVQYWFFYHQWWVCKVCNGNISSPLALSCHVLDFYNKMFQAIRGDFVLSTRITGLNWLEYLWLEGIALLKYHVFYEEYVKNKQVTNSKEYYRLKTTLKG